MMPLVLVNHSPRETEDPSCSRERDTGVVRRAQGNFSIV